MKDILINLNHTYYIKLFRRSINTILHKNKAFSNLPTSIE